MTRVAGVVRNGETVIKDNELTMTVSVDSDEYKVLNDLHDNRDVLEFDCFQLGQTIRFMVMEVRVNIDIITTATFMLRMVA